jgi:nitrile hydratase accessory protein
MLGNPISNRHEQRAVNSIYVDAAHAPLEALPGLPRDAEGPVFEEPWQAHAFAMTVSLHERGVFTWPEWSNALAHQIRSAADHDSPSPRDAPNLLDAPNHGAVYYLHWLKALEALLATKSIASSEELSHFQDAWRRAAERTLHGAPIVLADEDLSVNQTESESAFVTKSAFKSL